MIGAGLNRDVAGAVISNRIIHRICGDRTPSPLPVYTCGTGCAGCSLRTGCAGGPRLHPPHRRLQPAQLLRWPRWLQPVSANSKMMGWRRARGCCPPEWRCSWSRCRHCIIQRIGGGRTPSSLPVKPRRARRSRGASRALWARGSRRAGGSLRARGSRCSDRSLRPGRSRWSLSSHLGQQCPVRRTHIGFLIAARLDADVARTAIQHLIIHGVAGGRVPGSLKVQSGRTCRACGSSGALRSGCAGGSRGSLGSCGTRSTRSSLRTGGPGSAGRAGGSDLR